MSTNYHRMKHMSVHKLAKTLWSMHVCVASHRQCIENKPYRDYTDIEHIACMEASLRQPTDPRKTLLWYPIAFAGHGIVTVRNKGRSFYQAFRRLSKDAMRSFLFGSKACPLHSYGMRCPLNHRSGEHSECWHCIQAWLDQDTDRLHVNLKEVRKAWEASHVQDGW